MKKYNNIIFLIIGLLIVVLLKSFLVDKNCVNGNSMSDTFKDGDVLLIEKFNNEIIRYDVVIIKTKEQGLKSSVIKRVIGLPNETIQIINGYVYIDNEKLVDDCFSKEQIENSGIAEAKILLGEDDFFVLGDNRNNSEDSRNEWLGIIKRSQIKGKPFARIYPFNKFEFLK